MGNLSLRQVLLADALTCAAMGLVLVVSAAPLAGLLDLPAPLLFYAGLALLPIAAFMALVGLQATPPLWGVRLVILGNLAWVLASIGLPLSGTVAPNGLGLAFLLAQALAVAFLALFEYRLAEQQPSRT